MNDVQARCTTGSSARASSSVTLPSPGSSTVANSRAVQVVDGDRVARVVQPAQHQPVAGERRRLELVAALADEFAQRAVLPVQRDEPAQRRVAGR